MKQSSKKVHFKPGGPEGRSKVLDIDASMKASPEFAKAVAQREAVLEAGGAIEFWMKNARRADGGTGLKQAELARLLGVTQARISQLVNAERGQGPSYALLRRICVACGFSWPDGLVAALQDEAQGQAQQDDSPARVRRELSSKAPGYAFTVATPILSPRDVKRVTRLEPHRKPPAPHRLQYELQQQITSLASTLDTLDDIERSIYEAALRNLLEQPRQASAISEDFAIVRIDEDGTLDLEHLTIIETGGQMP